MKILNFLRSIRLWIMWVPAVLVLYWYYKTDPNGGAETLARLQWLAWIAVLVGPTYILRRALFPEARSRLIFAKAVESPTGAGLVAIALAIVTGALLLALSFRAGAVPVNALKYLPILKAEQTTYWEQMPHPATLAAQVEQETCASLTSKRCWNPTTELKTTREYGFGLGQLTITPRFNNFNEARKLDLSLRSWAWEDRYNPAKQLRTAILMNKANYQRLSYVPDPEERLAMSYSAYNGGFGGLASDRRLCALVKGCDANRWFGNVEKYSLKAKAAVKGYGQSFFQINRNYVIQIVAYRVTKYEVFFGA